MSERRSEAVERSVGGIAPMHASAQPPEAAAQ
jgi:hypothetical protein